jgi:hypothetical protein
LDIGILLLIITDQHPGLIDNSPLADLIGLVGIA